jgi:hypothetical protein
VVSEVLVEGCVILESHFEVEKDFQMWRKISTRVPSKQRGSEKTR